MAIGNDMGSDGFLPKSFATPPEEAVDTTESTQPIESAPQAEPVAQTPVTAEPVQPAKVEGEIKPDTFIEDLNKRFGSQFKSDEEVKGLFGLPQKIADYDKKIKDSEDNVKRIEELEKLNDEIKSASYSELLSKPLLRNAFVAEQLLAKYPDKDPLVLQEIVMADVSKMDDLAVLIKELKIDLPNTSERDLREALLDKYGIDPETKPEEWSSVAKTKIAIDAKNARANIRNLTQGIELPKMVTREERDRLTAETAQRRQQQLDPFKAKYLQFDKFKDERIADFEYDVPSEFKGKLGDIFNGFFGDAGLDATDENYATAVELRDALMIKENLPKILEIALKKGQTEAQKKLDEALDNKNPPNTTTKTDVEPSKEEPLPGPSLLDGLRKNF